MPDDSLQTVQLRNDFYRDGQRKLFIVVLVSICANAILAILLMYIASHPPAPKQDGRR